MATIPQLNQVQSVALNDLIPIYVSGQGNALRVPAGKLADAVSAGAVAAIQAQVVAAQAILDQFGDVSALYDEMVILRDQAQAAVAGAATTAQLYGRAGQAGAVNFRNRIINGNFSVNQRAVAGPVVLVAGAYGHDRWKAGPGGCTYTVAPGAPDTAITITVGTLQQVIEFNMLEGGQMVLSWDGSAQARVGSSAYSASPLVATVPAGTALAIEFSTGSIGKVQFEMGNVPTAFERRPPSIELALCQRYFQVVAVGFNGSAVSAGITYGGTVNIPTMRATPFCAWKTDSEVQNFPAGSLNLQAVNASWVKFSKTASGSGPAYYSSSFTADAEI